MANLNFDGLAFKNLDFSYICLLFSLVIFTKSKGFDVNYAM